MRQSTRQRFIDIEEDLKKVKDALYMDNISTYVESLDKNLYYILQLFIETCTDEQLVILSKNAVGQRDIYVDHTYLSAMIKNEKAKRWCKEKADI